MTHSQTEHEEYELSADDFPEPETTLRLRTWPRGFRRRCSNIAWVLGGAASSGLCAAYLAEEAGWLPTGLPDGLLALLFALAVSALVTIAVSTRDAATKADEQWFRGINVDGDVVTLAGELRRTIRLHDIQGVLSSGKNAWLVLHSGDVVQLLFFRDEETQRAEGLFPPHLRAAPVDVVPTPSKARHALVLFLVGSFVMSIAEEFLRLPFALWFGALTLLTWRAAVWLRGSRLVVARDGVRVGSRFYSLDRLTHFLCTSSDVSWTHKGKTRVAKVRIPEHLASALHRRVLALIESEAPSDDALERHEGEDVHAWLGRVAGLFRGGDFRQPALMRERVIAAAKGKGSLRVRVAVLAALKDVEPELLEEAGRGAADPRFVRALDAIGDDATWREVVDALERDGLLEAER